MPVEHALLGWMAVPERSSKIRGGRLLVSRTNRYAGLSLVAGLVLLSCSATTIVPLEWRSLFWGVPAFMIVYGLSGLETKLNWWAPLILLGDCSYTLYLSHPLIIGLYHGVLKRRVLGNAKMETASIACVVACCGLAAVVAYVLIEKPMLASMTRWYGHAVGRRRSISGGVTGPFVTENGRSSA